MENWRNKDFGRRNNSGFNEGKSNGWKGSKGFSNLNRQTSKGWNNSGRNYNKSDQTRNAFGIKRLTEFLTQENDEVIMALHKSTANFQQNLRLANEDDVMILLIRIIGEKICGETSLLEIQNNLVVLCTEASFLEKIIRFTSQIPSLLTSLQLKKVTPDRILDALSAFYGRLCARMPAFAADKLLPYIQGAVNVTELLCFKGALDKEKSTEIGCRLNLLIDNINSTKAEAENNLKVVKRIKFQKQITAEDRERLYNIIPDEKFEKMAIIPTEKEIVSEEEPFLRPNLTYGKYPSSLTYLDVQFRLLREDFLAPLREAIKEYLINANEYDSHRRRPPPGTIRIYRDVRLQKVHCTQEVTLFTMKFATNNLRRVKWENSKRLLSGSLLILTPNSFKNIFFASVRRRDVRNLRSGLIDIVWEGKRPDTYNNLTFLMIECEVYFESYRHTLKALQHMAAPCPPQYDRLRLETFKMCKYIVDVTSDEIQPPEYIRAKNVDFKMVLEANKEAIKSWKKRKPEELKSHEINALELADWPTAEQLGMDEPQYNAFQSAITQELAIIQGPPGTGKTYIGLQIMKLLLSNDLIDCPILIVCYTNHALDQFLEGIISIMNSLHINPYGELIRVGGQSKVEEIQNYNIRNIREEYVKQKKFQSNYAQLRSSTRHNLLMHLNRRANLTSLFSDLNEPEGIVNFAKLNEQIDNIEECDFDLHSIFPSKIASLFLNGNKLFEWLRMKDYQFDSKPFSSDNLLKRWFTMTSTNTRHLQDVAIPEKEEVEEENEDEELRNILVAHRMEEEIMEEERQYKAARLEYYFSKRKIEQEFQSKENELWSKLESDHRNARLLEGQLFELGLQKNKFMNQCTFITDLFRCYRDGRIVLPTATAHLIDQANEWNTLWNLPINEKWAIYFHFIDEIKKRLIENVIKLEPIIMDDQKKMKEVKNQGDGFILERAKVVGMTTTGAAKYNTVLRMMKSKIVIFEEAAEVLESHIVTSITEDCEHLILIGDHKQLRPPTTVYKLAKDYQLDISLFERLIKNNIKWKYLRAQHRMRPEISRLLVPTIYEDLEDHSSVHSYPSVKGFLKNIFFITHSEEEKSDNDSMTKSNEYEAHYIAQLCRHLVLQGYLPSQITILTTYIGQMFLIKKLMLGEGSTCMGVRVTVVDNFQGEENDIILLSLVRSNVENKIGFLRIENRICVALSRAKQGFYIVGNMDCLINSPSNTWKKISDELQTQESIGPVLHIRCQNHDDVMEINSPEEFRRKSPEGGCTKMCSGVLPRCDHACRSICHINDREHTKYQCKEKCERHCPDTAQHKCPDICFRYPCPPCQIKMQRTLSCTHVIDLACYIDIATYSCQQLVCRSLKCDHTVRLPCSVPVEEHVCRIKENKTLDCGHTKLLPCNIPTTEYECIEMVTKELDCGHTGKMKCIDDPSKFDCLTLCTRILACGHEQMAPCKDDIASIMCQTIVDEIKVDCKHEVKIPCNQLGSPEKWICPAGCDTRLNCGHQCMRKCHLNNDPNHVDYVCGKNCARSCVNDHRCRKNHPCHEKCPPCKRSITKTLDCDHEVNAFCSENLDEWQCKEPCQRNLPCGHQCSKTCDESCSPCQAVEQKKSIDCPHTVAVACSDIPSKSKCNELVPSTKMSLCGHVVRVPCRIQDSCSPEDCLKYCIKPCEYKFDYDGGCGHACQGNCSSCFQGRIHVKCSSKCERTLACGHICKFPCASVCPPCEDVCRLQCKHSKCKKKCGEPCINCKENCKWACKHAKCSKKCSDKCNRDPCNEPCKQKLKCGHDCIGYCGDPCPPYCRFCDKDTVQEILFGEEAEEDARFVYLENCDHIIHRESMDTWMSDKKDDHGSSVVDVKRCPKCKTVITNCARYGNIIKKQLEDVFRIRKKVFGNNERQKQTQQNIALKIQRWDNCFFKNVKQFLEKKIFFMKRIQVSGKPKIDLHLVDVDQYTFESLHNIVCWWEDAENTITKELLTLGCKDEVIGMFNKFFDVLLFRKLPLSSQEISDFDQEFSKVYDFSRLGLRRGVKNFDSFSGALDTYNAAHMHIMQNKPYDKDRQKVFENHLLELEAVIKIGWEAEQQKHKNEIRSNREKIFSAMGFEGNHWYRCAKGHLYVVADCGALNESGNCPECRSRIGRGSRNVNAVRDNTAIQQQINSVVDIFPEEMQSAPSFQDRHRGGRQNRRYNNRGGRNRNR